MSSGDHGKRSGKGSGKDQKSGGNQGVEAFNDQNLGTNKPTHSQRRLKSVTQMAGLMSLGTLCSRVLGFVRDRLIIQFFPTQTTDAFYAAFRLPNFFRILLGEGALSVSFLPAYIDLKEKSGDHQKLAGALWAFLLILGSLLSALGVLFMPQLLDLILDVNQISKVPGKYETTLFFSQIMFSYLFLVSQFAFFMALLNSHEEFFIPGLAPAIFNLTIIVTISFFPEHLFFSRESFLLPMAIILGGITQFLIVFVKAFSLKIVPRPNFIFSNPRFLEVLHRTAPSIVGIGAIQLLGLLNLRFASSLDQGSITFLYLANRLLELPQSILAISLSAALLPRLTSFWSRHDKKSFVNQIYETTSVYYFLAIPSAIGLFVLAEPLVMLLFFTENLAQEGVQITATLVQAYAFMILISGTSKLLLPGFYAIKNTIYPAAASGLVVGIHLFLAPYLMKSLGLQGLVVSTIVSSFVALCVSFVAFQTFVMPLNLIQFFRPIPKIIGLNIITLGITLGTLFLWRAQESLMFKNIITLLGVG